MKKTISLTDQELTHFAVMFKSAHRDSGVRGRCLEFSAALVSMLNAVGFPCVLSTGTAVLDSGVSFHAWVTLPGGDVLDVTLEQFGPEAGVLGLNAGVYLGMLPKFLTPHSLKPRHP